MRHEIKVLSAFICLLLITVSTVSWQKKVFANEPVKHQSSSVELGVLGQLSFSHVVPSVGAYALILNDSFEIHASAWANPLAYSGGVGTGTLHSVSDRFWLGWEISAEVEKEDLFFGLGPVLEIQVVQHRLHTFFKVPLGLEHTTRHDNFGWAAIAGLTVAIWH